LYIRYRVELTDTPRIIAAIRIDRVLHVDAFKGELKLDSHLLEWILGKDCIIGCWSQLSSLLSHLAGLVDKNSDLSISDTVACTQRALDGLYNRLNSSECDDFDANVQNRLRFLTEQFSLLFASQRRYSCDMLTFAFRLVCVSRSAIEH